MKKPELGFCACGKPAEIVIEAGGHRVALCDPCWQKKTARLLADLERNEVPHV